ncbi:hypothetical protein H8S90_08165 [Olivibacter sp. SDN3]|uniref:hypothetical protein n=1 Tax=Olivibacter sp. SDN3 TaxID=2764720 RepID=UPI0016516F5B|nr:hypothetical protein [Olivibacter sp. SDN3]QNL51536.1 hypothetical protein H8S90_08165 [Olivibacter sp. SDN3]
MKKTPYIFWLAAILLLTTVSGCDLFVGVFKGGVYVGVFLVLLVLALIVWLLMRIRR